MNNTDSIWQLNANSFNVLSTLQQNSVDAKIAQYLAGQTPLTSAHNGVALRASGLTIAHEAKLISRGRSASV